jgi:hypothetical protein
VKLSSRKRRDDLKGSSSSRVQTTDNQQDLLACLVKTSHDGEKPIDPETLLVSLWRQRNDVRQERLLDDLSGIRGERESMSPVSTPTIEFGEEERSSPNGRVTSRHPLDDLVWDPTKEMNGLWVVVVSGQCRGIGSVSELSCFDHEFASSR